MATSNAIATFTASAMATFTWDPPLTSSLARILDHSLTISDGSGFVGVTASADPSGQGGTLNATAAFTGVVELVGGD